MVPEQKNPVTVATTMVAEEESEGDESSERLEGVTRVTWPNNKPSTAPGEDANRWIMEARVGPDIAILCRGGSSMAPLCSFGGSLCFNVDGETERETTKFYSGETDMGRSSNRVKIIIIIIII